MSPTPLFEAHGCRLSVGGQPVLGPFDATSTGDVVALAGDVGSLVALLTNVPPGAIELARGVDPTFAARDTVEVIGGALRIAGRDPTSPAARAATGVAPLDPPVPGDLTVSEYLVASARLAGLGAAAKVEAARVLDVVEGRDAARRKLATLGLAERRVLLLAQAILGRPDVIVVESPLAHLDAEAATFVLGAFQRATEGTRVIVSVESTRAGTRDAPIVERATTLLQFRGGALVACGAPTDRAASSGVRLALTVRSNGEGLARELAAKGLTLEGGPIHFTLTLADGMSTDVVMRAASAARAAVVELAALG